MHSHINALSMNKNRKSNAITDKDHYHIISAMSSIIWIKIQKIAPYAFLCVWGACHAWGLGMVTGMPLTSTPSSAGMRMKRRPSMIRVSTI